MQPRSSLSRVQDRDQSNPNLQYSNESSQDARTDSDRVVEESPNRRYAKVALGIMKMNQVLGKGAYKIVFKAIDREEGYEVAWNTCQVSST